MYLHLIFRGKTDPLPRLTSSRKEKQPIPKQAGTNVLTIYALTPCPLFREQRSFEIGCKSKNDGEKNPPIFFLAF
jgi:hypothetical protein